VKCPQCQFENPVNTHFCGQCGAPLNPAQEKGRGTETFQTGVLKELATGSTFAGRYQVIEELGKGGMGRVYKVIDEKIKEKIALKLLKPEISTDEQAIERFSNELRLSRKISHRHVCRMFDLGEARGTHYITMEYVSGEDLKSILRMMGPMSAGKVVFIAKQVAEGLAEAHRLGVVHRDLKPQNIMVDREGNVRIMDFGIARSLKVKGLTGAGMVIGTPEYMSPEQIEGQEVDNRSDIYSLGIILYEMTTGRVPFEGDTFLSIAVKQKTEKPRNPQDLNAQIPDDINRLILRCLEKSKEKRYQRAEDILADLAKIEKGIPTTEKVLPSLKPSTSREITVKFRPRKLVLPAIGFLALVAAVVLLFRFLPHRKAMATAGGKPNVAIMYFKNDTGDPSLDIWRSALPELLVADLSQSRYIDVVSMDRLYSLFKKLNLQETVNYASEDLQNVASGCGATHIIQGILTKSGNSFRINAILQDSGTLKNIASEEVNGQGQESFHAMVDDLKTRIKQDFQLTPQQMSSDPDKDINQITTSSAEAFRYYSEARKYHLREEYRKSIALLEKAVAIDPEFAMAYRSMATAYDNLYLHSEAEKYIKRAMELSQRLSDREKYIIEGSYYTQFGRERDWPRAIEAFTKLVELYPDDNYGNYQLGAIYALLEQWDKARQYYELCLKNKYEFVSFYNALADIYRAQNMYDQAQNVLESYLRNVADDSVIRCYFAYNYYSQGKLDEALREVDRATTLDPTDYYNYSYYSDIYLLQGDFRKAELENSKLLEEKEALGRYWGYVGFNCLFKTEGKFGKLIDLFLGANVSFEKAGAKDAEWNGRMALAHAYLLFGNPVKALEECRKAWDISLALDQLGFQRQTLELEGQVYLALHSLGGAQETADKLKAVIDSGPRKNEIRRYRHLAGLIELEKKNYPQAIEYLRQAADSLPYGPQEKDVAYVASLALAYERSGDLEKAQQEYEKISASTAGRLGSGDIYARSFFHLGRIYERQGNKAKAAENYKKFLDLWKGADPGLPEVPEAKKRLEALQ
jgi:tetratricopeptide (TPR) repeat protein/tRNA A-37 threonylcarbamoyl transferase component Bud32